MIIGDRLRNACDPPEKHVETFSLAFPLHTSGEPMTVYEVRAKLSEVDDNKQVFVYWEDEENENHVFGIQNISVQRGSPIRLADGKAGFTFDGKGPAEWVFVEISPE